LIILIATHLAVAYYTYKYINNRWKLKYKEHTIKAIKLAKEKRDEIENLNDDELGERLARWGM
jgi:hypothetical protein